MQTNFLVLLAEDDLDDQEMLIEALELEHPGLEVLTATSGSKVLEMLSQCASKSLPSLVILDFNLPEMNGAEILARIQQMADYEKVVKVVWSTSNSPIYQKKCMELGARCFFVKPVGIAGIRSVAREMLALSTTA